ncbi:MAG: NADH-quinone oxidoreductase subunit I [Syntrophorhabdaceae bacterium PtaU1.Bin034]|jgi:ferredoxin|nr:MAG: NADH-quinone oxidoreductase subunit I [Syntrophorhabdaceae bacterium PtaU1.Bin034]
MKKRIILRFKKNTIDKPIVYRLAKDFDLVYNILRANVSPRAESLMVMEIEGDEADFAKGVEYLKTWNIAIEPIGQDIARNEDKCVHCGLCTSVCATQALDIDRETMRVGFDYEKCVACELCVKVCPVKAMNVYFT